MQPWGSPLSSWGLGDTTKAQLKGERKLHHWPFPQRGRLPLGSRPRASLRAAFAGHVRRLRCKRARRTPVRAGQQTPRQVCLSRPLTGGSTDRGQRLNAGKAGERRRPCPERHLTAPPPPATECGGRGENMSLQLICQERQKDKVKAKRQENAFVSQTEGN